MSNSRALLALQNELWPARVRLVEGKGDKGSTDRARDLIRFIVFPLIGEIDKTRRDLADFLYHARANVNIRMILPWNLLPVGFCRVFLVGRAGFRA